MGGVVDFISDTVSDVGDFLGDAVDFVEDTIDDAVDLFEDIGDFLEETGEFLEDVGRGVEFLVSGALEGDMKSVIAIGGIALGGWGLYYGIAGGAFATGLSAAGALGLSGLSAQIVGFSVMGLSIAASLYSVYGIVVGLETLGKAIKSGSLNPLNAMLGQMRDAINLAFVNSWMNGSMNMWMAGGVLYDSPKAGDLLFNPTGDLNSTKHLNVENKNSNTWSRWSNGKYHDFQRNVFGNMAGDMFFSVSPIAQRI